MNFSGSLAVKGRESVENPINHRYRSDETYRETEANCFKRETPQLLKRVLEHKHLSCETLNEICYIP